VELRLAEPELPPAETPAPLPAEPPLLDDVLAAAVELLSPEFSFGCCEPAEALPAGAVCPLPGAPRWTSVPA
jgi:hypothetical protein